MNESNSSNNSKPTHGRQARRRRRPQRQAGMRDTTVPSPCLSVCRFDGAPHCIGCFRNADEIREWMIMTREQKLEVLAKLPERKLLSERSAKDTSTR